jgi:enoyl-CoA hydratase/carnithine racemase
MSREEAYGRGLMNRIVPEERLSETAEGLARKIVSYNPTAVRNAKAAVTRGLDLSLSEGLELERRLASGLRRQGVEPR